MVNEKACFPHFRRLLEYLKNENADFVRFEAIAYKPPFEARSVGLRFDVHLRDIENAYGMLMVEKEVLERIASTSFVMWGLAGSTMLEALTEIIHAKRYDKYVEFCLNNEAEVQPHISPLNDYIRRFQPNWSTWDETKIIDSIKLNYSCSIDDGGIEFNVIRDDVLGLDHLNQQVVCFLQEYDFLWHAKYGVEPRGYAVHGNSLPFNRVMTNAVLLNQRLVKRAYPNRYEVHSSEIRAKLSLYSDCTFPYWMWSQPEFEQQNLQLLIHPAQWSTKRIDERYANASAEQKAKGHLNYPYATPLDTIVNPLDFINSGLSRYDYSEKTKSCFYL